MKISQQSETITVISTAHETPSSSGKSKKDGHVSSLPTHNHLPSEPSLFPLLHPPLPEDVGPMVWSIGKHMAARPGRAERLKSDPTSEYDIPLKPIETHSTAHQHDHSKETKILQKSASMDVHHHLDEECLQRFIKVSVRLKTEDHVSMLLLLQRKKLCPW